MPHDRPADPSSTDAQHAGFRLLVVPGVNPSKWLAVWQERLPDVPLTLVHATVAEQEDVLRSGGADAGLVRLPVDRTDLSAIPLYTETTVVVAPKDHLVAAAEDVTTADLADDVLIVPADDVLAWAEPPGEPSALPTPATTAQAVELVAAGAGVLAVPQSIARLHHRRDVLYRPVTDAPTSSVALAWPTDDSTDLVEELIGIVRGRTVNSSRGRAATTGAPEATGGASAARTGRDGDSRGSGGGAASRRGTTGRRSGQGQGQGKGPASGQRRGSGRGRGTRRPR